MLMTIPSFFFTYSSESEDHPLRRAVKPVQIHAKQMIRFSTARRERAAQRRRRIEPPNNGSRVAVPESPHGSCFPPPQSFSSRKTCILLRATDHVARRITKINRKYWTSNFIVFIPAETLPKRPHQCFHYRTRRWFCCMRNHLSLVYCRRSTRNSCGTTFRFASPHQGPTTG